MQRVFAVTGSIHGSIVFATSKKEASGIFRLKYPKEKILKVKDISNYNLSNI